MNGIRHWNGCWWRRAVVIAAAAFLLVQTFSAAFATAAAIGAASGKTDPSAALCHDDADPGHSGHSGRGGTHAKLPCALCIMTVGGLILPDAGAEPFGAEIVFVRIIAPERALPQPWLPRPRAGQSQAPPSIA